MFDISLGKTLSRNAMFAHLVYNKDKIIYFIEIFILINIYIA